MEARQTAAERLQQRLATASDELAQRANGLQVGAGVAPEYTSLACILHRTSYAFQRIYACISR